MQNRLSPQQRLRLLDRPEVIQALGDETVEDTRRDLEASRARARVPTPRSRARSTAAAAIATSHAAIPFDLNTTMSSCDCLPGSSPDTTSWSSCTSSQSSTPC